MAKRLSIPVKDVNEPYVRPCPWRHLGNRQSRQRGIPEGRPGRPAAWRRRRRRRRQGGNSEKPTRGRFRLRAEPRRIHELLLRRPRAAELVKTQLASTTEFKNQRAGYNISGTPANIHVLRSLRGALGGASRSAASIAQAPGARRGRAGELAAAGATTTIRAVVKLRARDRASAHAHLTRFPSSTRSICATAIGSRCRSRRSQAVMFCVMDVSGSMDEQRKDTAKRFFILLYLFLNARTTRSRWSSSATIRRPPRSTSTNFSIRANRAAPSCPRRCICCKASCTSATRSGDWNSLRGAGFRRR